MVHNLVQDGHKDREDVQSEWQMSSGISPQPLLVFGTYRQVDT